MGIMPEIVAMMMMIIIIIAKSYAVRLILNQRCSLNTFVLVLRHLKDMKKNDLSLRSWS